MKTGRRWLDQWLYERSYLNLFAGKLDSQTKADIVFVELGDALSDERLYQDGERSPREAQREQTYLVRVVKDLLALGYVIRGDALRTDGLYGGALP